MIPPGCKTADIIKVDRKPGGWMCTLACGHTMWYGGAAFPPEYLPCLIGPCYQYQRFMGDSYGI